MDDTKVKFSSIFDDATEEAEEFDNTFGAEQDDADMEFVDSLSEAADPENTPVGELDDDKMNEPGPDNDSKNKPTDDSSDIEVIAKDYLDSAPSVACDKHGVEDAQGASSVDPEDITASTDKIATDKNLKESYEELMREADAELADDAADAGNGVDNEGVPEEKPIEDENDDILDSLEDKDTGTTVDDYSVNGTDAETSTHESEESILDDTFNSIDAFPGEVPGFVDPDAINDVDSGKKTFTNSETKKIGESAEFSLLEGDTEDAANDDEEDDAVGDTDLPDSAKEECSEAAYLEADDDTATDTDDVPAGDDTTDTEDDSVDADLDGVEGDDSVAPEDDTTMEEEPADDTTDEGEDLDIEDPDTIVDGSDDSDVMDDDSELSDDTEEDVDIDSDLDDVEGSDDSKDEE